MIVVGETRSTRFPLVQAVELTPSRVFFASFDVRDLLAGGTNPPPPEPCTAGPSVLCLGSDRFEVQASWRDVLGNRGSASAAEITDDTGTFSFFDPANIEIVIKVLAGCSVNNHYWVYGTGLTDLEVDLQVRDTVSGQLRSYNSPVSTAFVPIQDINAFDC